MPLELIYVAGEKLLVRSLSSAFGRLGAAIIKGVNAATGLCTKSSDHIDGVSRFMGGESAPSRAVVQSAGQGYWLRARGMKDEFNCAGSVSNLLLRYTQSSIQMSQTAVCNRHHTLDQQLCRWLLLGLDHC